MATISLKNVPDDLYRRLKESAERNSRSLNAEAIRHLERMVPRDAPLRVDEALARADAFRESLAREGFSTTQAEIQAAIDRERP